ncbi:MAG: RdgB/HAM1 family non-canonical purine NTP pyrophosphatase [SAR86 cluster bacterium]|nr:RdgB/HAM1 family non-canonical purine NTP pyrophosphatase [Gammaproteobacteria bacterium]MDG2347548.1 RdgB/HAM1 family non-canonical purine NTP pyrophosphatase [SAR86 cluster bacterium]
MAHKQQLVVATNNKGKLKEFSLLLPAFEIIAQSSLNIVPEEELGKTFFENSIQKARVANNASGIAALGDDSGLIVPALNNLPGLHSARYAHKNANDEENREHLKNELEKIDLLEAKAYFVCVLVLIQAPQDPFPLVATSMLEGIVKTNSQGKNGFGYDPMFYPAGSNHSLAEMDESEKAQISHRGKAVEVLQRKILGFSSE